MHRRPDARPIPVTGAWRAGRSARAPAVRDAVRRAAARAARRRTARRRSRSRTRRGGRSHADACNAVLVLHALTGDSHAAGAVEPGHVAARLVGRADRARARDRHRPVLRRVPERARRLPGHDRAVVDRSRRPARPYGSRFPTITIRDQVAVEAALADALGIERWASVVGGSMGGQRALEWAVTYPERVPHAVIIACGAAATAEQIALCSLQIRAIEADPHFHGGDYYDAERRTVARPVARARHRPGQLPHRARARAAVQPRPPERRASVRGRAVHDRVVPRVPRREARPPLRREHLHRAVAGDEPSRRRPRAAAVCAAALGRITAEVTIAGISSDRLYPLRLQEELAELIPNNRACT